MEPNSAANLSTSRSGQTLVAAWDELLTGLGEDWSDLLVELELRPDEPYQPVALIASPLNPEHCDKRSAFRFRVGHDAGYGASTSTARHCLELLDRQAIEGHLHLSEALSQQRLSGTQGPVWRLEGRSL